MMVRAQPYRAPVSERTAPVPASLSTPLVLTARLVFAALIVLFAGKVLAQTNVAAGEAAAESLQMGISVDVVPVTSEFSGRQIAVFGTIEDGDKMAQALNEYAVVVTITGPLQNILVRRKERVFGVWMNRQSRLYRDVPTFYTVASNRELSAITDEETLRENLIGIDYYSLSLYSVGDQIYTGPAPEFAASLRRLRRERSLYSEDPAGVAFLGSSLFRASMAIPSNVPIGEHKVTAYLFRGGKLLASRSANFDVERAGSERYLYTLAHSYSFWYGVIAVVIALATGWLGSVVFGGRR